MAHLPFQLASWAAQTFDGGKGGKSGQEQEGSQAGRGYHAHFLGGVLL